MVGSRRAHALSIRIATVSACAAFASLSCGEPKLVYAPTEVGFSPPARVDGGGSLASSESSLGAAEGAARAFSGVWRDSESNTDFSIVLRGGIPIVESAVDEDDGETYVVLGSTFQAGQVGWSIRVGSTGVTVRYECGDVSDDHLECTWWATGTSGTESLTRISGP